MQPQSGQAVLFGDDANNERRVDKYCSDVKNTIMQMEQKKGTLLLSWLEQKIRLIALENTTASTAGYYSRGQIVHVEFGFNVGSEEGGGRFAVVLWDGANGGTVTVAPMTSLKPGKEKDLQYDFHVNLGECLEDGTISVVKVQQIRAVSKLRVRPLQLKTRTRTYKVDHLTPDQLDLIDIAVMRLYTGSKQSITIRKPERQSST